MLELATAIKKMIAITATTKHPTLLCSRLVYVCSIGVMINDGPSCGQDGPMIEITRMMTAMEIIMISMTILLVISRWSDIGLMLNNVFVFISYCLFLEFPLSSNF